MTGDARFHSWNRRLARLAVGPFADTGLRPNHITSLRIATGLAACAALADPAWALWGGALWVVSAFLDRCDGEFARMTGRMTRFGKVYDLTGDIVINALVFLTIGVGQATATGDPRLLAAGIAAASGVAVAAVAAEVNERGMAPGRKSFDGRFGFDFDDVIYLIALFVWFDAQVPLLIGAALGGPLTAVVIVINLVRKRSG